MNNVLIDYFTFTSKIHSVAALQTLLGFESLPFENTYGFYGYKDALYFDGVRIMYNGKENMGVCVEMSGQGCRVFETMGNGDYNSLFKLIEEYYDSDAEKREMNVTRLDVAYDDFDGIIDLYGVYVPEAQRRNWVARSEDFDVHVGNKGASVNHYSTKSNVYIRIYDKKAERKKGDEVPHWVRCEIQLRKENALGFVKLLCSGADIRKCYFDVLNNYLRYIIPSDGNTTNKRVLPSAPYWLQFIESYETKSIYCKPGIDYNIMNVHNFVHHQANGAICTLIDVRGVDGFLKDVFENRVGKRVNPKYTQIKEEMKKTDTDPLLQYLEDRGLL